MSRLDESFSYRSLQKSLTGDAGLKPEWSKIVVSPSGQVQPAPVEITFSPDVTQEQREYVLKVCNDASIEVVSNVSDKVWFVTSIRIIPPLKREYCFPLWKRIYFTLMRTVRSRGNFQKLKDNWISYQDMKSPFMLATWGFINSKEDAIKYVLQNRTDIHENYYDYAVVEGLSEGFYSLVKPEDQTFFYFVDDKWVQLPQIPHELKKLCEDSHYAIQFVTL